MTSPYVSMMQGVGLELERLSAGTMVKISEPSNRKI